MRQLHTVVAVTAGLLGVGSHARAAFSGPTPYLSFADSPFNAVSFQAFHLETFEDGVLNTPGVVASAGWGVLPPAPATDSVDADDGVIDGSGTAGRTSWSSFSTNTLSLTFDAGALGGALPTHVGVVWTDVAADSIGGFGFGGVTFSAIDANLNPLGTVGPFTLGDGAITGATAEDRFFGISYPAGISSVTISMPGSNDWEVDHIQYGIVPEPSAIAAIVGTLFATLRRRIGRLDSTQKC